MGIAQQPDGGQPALWNGPAGHAWAAMQQTLDRMFEPFEETLAEAATHATQVLDVGCGAGSTTLALAGRLGTRGSCHGIDVSGPLVALARTRAVKPERKYASRARTPKPTCSRPTASTSSCRASA